jgi:hypothetical protein
MARVLRDFPVPDDPLQPKGALRRAWWRTIKESFSHVGFKIKFRPLILVALSVMVYHWGLPHALLSYRYSGEGLTRFYYSCEYIGWKPFIRSGRSCPIVIWVPWENLGR